jgi:hypothetical protein
MNEILFVVFATVEAWSIFAISFTLFRFNVLKYSFQTIPVSILMALLSYAIWHETEWDSWIPVITLILFTLFIFYMLRISLIGSIIVGIIGYGTIVMIQTAFLHGLQLAGIVTVAEVQLGGSDYYLLSAVSSCTVLLLCVLLYRLGYGFSFSLHNFKVQHENVLILLVTIVTFVLLSFLHLLKNKLYFVELVAVAIVLFLVFFALKKERTQW